MVYLLWVVLWVEGVELLLQLLPLLGRELEPVQVQEVERELVQEPEPEPEPELGQVQQV